ncbi:reverse transcriptase-like protein [Salipaludibacillus daqingensis]|uniref:reverse transcriptase-like protein n=1 Tax=Salipaludibacillus daqingensis TaxID=3041001 RepID=UPI002473CF65|nr:reverse transcriptase-like protein [Salipaludibacillus daqingensis]
MIELYIDGGSAGDPGPSGAGVFIKGTDPVIRQLFPLKKMSNHEAEFHACIKGLLVCKEHQFSTVSIRSDSKVLVQAVEKEYVKNPTFKPLLQEILSIIQEDFDYVFIKWIPSKSNKEADNLAKRAIQLSLEKFLD